MLALFDVDEIKIDKILSNTLHKFIGDRPLYHFISETINRDVMNAGKYDSGKRKLLMEPPEFSNAPDYMHKIFRDLFSFPWEYKVTFRLPTELYFLLDESKNEKMIGKSMKLLRVAEAIIDKFPLTRKMEGLQLATMQVGLGIGLLGNGYDDLKLDELFIQIDENGFDRVPGGGVAGGGHQRFSGRVGLRAPT